MGAGQIGGIATLLDIDFENAAGFMGQKAEPTEGQFVVYYLSHAMMFCMGGIIEAHVILTPAACVYGERNKFDVFGGTHRFVETSGTTRRVEHMCIHRAYNHTSFTTKSCSTNNIALMLLQEQFTFHTREPGTQYIMNRLRYGATIERVLSRIEDKTCKYYGWGSRRNGFLIPLLIDLFVVGVRVMPQDDCPTMWRGINDDYVCLQTPACWSEKYGALCPDDMGSIVVCSGLAIAMMTSNLIDRPCGTGFLDLAKFNKFLTCGVDDSRDVITHSDDYVHSFELSTERPLAEKLKVSTEFTPTPNEYEENEKAEAADNKKEQEENKEQEEKKETGEVEES